MPLRREERHDQNGGGAKKKKTENGENTATTLPYETRSCRFPTWKKRSDAPIKSLPSTKTKNDKKKPIMRADFLRPMGERKFVKKKREKAGERRRAVDTNRQVAHY